MLNIIAGIDKPTSGVIEKPLDCDIAYMFQQEVLLPWRTLINNVLLGVEIRDKQRKNFNDQNRYKWARELIELFGLSGFENAYPYELSGGMHQRTSLIQNIIYQPDLLLLDEPFSSLDYLMKLKLEIELYKLIRAHQITTILVTHDIEEAITISDRIILFRDKPLSDYDEFPVMLEDRTDPAKVRRSQIFMDLFSYLWRFFEETYNL